jgi:hypothetical protein
MGGIEGRTEMSVVSGLGKAAGAGVLSGSRPARGRAFRKRKKALVVAVALLAFAVFAALIPASQAPRAEHSYPVVSTDSQSGTAAPPEAGPDHDTKLREKRAR